MISEVITSWWKRLRRRRRYGKVAVVDSMSVVPERLRGTIPAPSKELFRDWI